MAMTVGSGELSSGINVTPLIDVLLVLLIIFMVIVPAVPKGLNALVPQPPARDRAEIPETIVVSVSRSQGAQTAYRVNQDQVAKADLLTRLTAIYANRAERVMFVKGDDDLDFAQIAEAIDISHSAGVSSVGLLSEKQ